MLSILLSLQRRGVRVSLVVARQVQSRPPSTPAHAHVDARHVHDAPRALRVLNGVDEVVRGGGGVAVHNVRVVDAVLATVAGGQAE